MKYIRISRIKYNEEETSIMYKCDRFLPVKTRN